MPAREGGEEDEADKAENNSDDSRVSVSEPFLQSFPNPLGSIDKLTLNKETQ